MNDLSRDKWSLEIKCSAYGYGIDSCGDNIIADSKTIFITDTCELWTGDMISRFAIKCPNCGKITFINSDLIPKRVQERIKINDCVPSYMRVFRK